MKPDEVARAAKRAKRTALEDRLAGQMRASGLPLPVREHRFDAVRRWRFDFAWPEWMLAVEVDGGEWVRGNHYRSEGLAADREKTLAADRAGWQVLHFTGGAVRSGAAVQALAEVMRAGA